MHYAQKSLHFLYINLCIFYLLCSYIFDCSYNEYYVRLGGNEDGYVYDTFTVGEGEPEQVLIGDADGDGEVLALDASEIVTFLADIEDNAINEADKNWYAAAYCTGDNEILALDASEVVTYLADISVDYVNTTVDIGKYGDKPTE